MSTEQQRSWPLVVWLGVLVAAVAGLHQLGHDPAYHLPSVAGSSTWVETVGAATAAVALLRVATMAAGLYLLAVTLLAVGLRVVRAHTAAALVERLAPSGVAKLVSAAVGLSVVASSLGLPLSAAGADEPDAPVVTMHRLPDPSTTTLLATVPTTVATGADTDRPRLHRLPDGSTLDASSTTTSAPSAQVASPSPAAGETPTAPDGDRPRLRRLPDGSTLDASSTTTSAPSATGPVGDRPRLHQLADGSTTTSSTTNPAPTVTSTEPVAETPPGPIATGSSPSTPPATGPDGERPRRHSTAAANPGTPSADSTAEHVVRAGDHLWGIAEAELRRSWGRAPSDREIDPYWRTLIEQNRKRLHDPANPDLLFPGDRITVPAAPAAP